MPSSTAGNVVVHVVGSLIRAKMAALADGENVRPCHSTEGGIIIINGIIYCIILCKFTR